MPLRLPHHCCHVRWAQIWCSHDILDQRLQVCIRLLVGCRFPSVGGHLHPIRDVSASLECASGIQAHLAWHSIPSHHAQCCWCMPRARLNPLPPVPQVQGRAWSQLVQGRRCGWLIGTDTPFEESPLALCASHAVQLALERPHWTPELNSLWPARFKARLLWLLPCCLGLPALPCAQERCAPFCVWPVPWVIALRGDSHDKGTLLRATSFSADSAFLPAGVYPARQLCIS